MAGVTKEEHERMMAPVAQCAERLRACAISADEAAKALAAFAEAARKLELPPLQEIARMRMTILAAEHGVFRFVMPSWCWRCRSDGQRLSCGACAAFCAGPTRATGYALLMETK